MEIEDKILSNSAWGRNKEWKSLRTEACCCSGCCRSLCDAERQPPIHLAGRQGVVFTGIPLSCIRDYIKPWAGRNSCHHVLSQGSDWLAKKRHGLSHLASESRSRGWICQSASPASGCETGLLLGSAGCVLLGLISEHHFFFSLSPWCCKFFNFR